MNTQHSQNLNFDMNQYMKERVDDQINWYDQKSNGCQKIYKTYQVIEIIIATLIPLLSGYSPNCTCITFIIGLSGSIIAIIESITKLFKWHENWISYRTTCELLRYQKMLYLTKSAPYNTELETVDNIFVKNVENIISSENNKWKTLNLAEKNNTNQTG